MHSLNYPKKDFIVIGKTEFVSDGFKSHETKLFLYEYCANHSLKPITRIDVCVATCYSISKNRL